MLHKVDLAIEAIKQGKMIIITDDENRENEGDLVMAAEKITPEAINFMAHFGCGLICMPMSDDYFSRLNIPMMVEKNQTALQTAFGVSIGAAKGITTGISAQDRAYTIKVAADPQSVSSDIVKPGHVFPLKAVKGGVLKRRGHTEASIDLMQLAGLNHAATICEVMNNDGNIARAQDLKKFSEKHQIMIISIQDIVDFRLSNEILVEKKSCAEFPTKFGNMRIHCYQTSIDDSLEWIVLTAGDIAKEPLVRIHSKCLAGDALHSLRCDCGKQLEIAMQTIADQGGILLYLPQEGRNIGLSNKIKSYALQDKGLDTVEANHALGFGADGREYSIAAQILKSMGADRIRLVTNNPQKISGLKKYGIDIAERISLMTPMNAKNNFYLTTKKNKMGHLLDL